MTQEEKVKFKNDTKDLEPEALGDIIRIIKENCFNAFVELEDGDCQILVDNLNQDTTRIIYEYINKLS